LNISSIVHLNLIIDFLYYQTEKKHSNREVFNFLKRISRLAVGTSSITFTSLLNMLIALIIIVYFIVICKTKIKQIKEKAHIFYVYGKTIAK